MRRRGFRESEILKEQKMKEAVVRKQWAEVFGVLAICGGAIVFFFMTYAHAMGVL